MVSGGKIAPVMEHLPDAVIRWSPAGSCCTVLEPVGRHGFADFVQFAVLREIGIHSGYDP